MEVNVRDWAPDMDRWPRSWMGVGEDLEYGKKLLSYFEEFLRDLIEQGVSRRTFAQYRDNAWLLGGSIISKISLYEEYAVDPLKKLIESVECDGILPDDYDSMSEAEMRSFERMCQRFEKFLRKEYQADSEAVRERRLRWNTTNHYQAFSGMTELRSTHRSFPSRTFVSHAEGTGTRLKRSSAS